MVIKSAELETVCGITSKLPENTFPEIGIARKDTDDQLLQYQQESVFC